MNKSYYTYLLALCLFGNNNQAVALPSAAGVAYYAASHWVTHRVLATTAYKLLKPYRPADIVGANTHHISSFVVGCVMGASSCAFTHYYTHHTANVIPILYHSSSWLLKTAASCCGAKPPLRIASIGLAYVAMGIICPTITSLNNLLCPISSSRLALWTCASGLHFVQTGYHLHRALHGNKASIPRLLYNGHQTVYYGIKAYTNGNSPKYKTPDGTQKFVTKLSIVIALCQ